MRLEKAESLLKLCILMASRHQGVSLDMIAEEFKVSRRTAERMRDAAVRLLPYVDESVDDEGFKYWRTRDLPKGLIAISADEIGALHASAEMMRSANRSDTAEKLAALADKLLASQSRQRQRQLEPDLELIMQSEGSALRPGPRVRLSSECTEIIREAILSSQLVQVSYVRRNETKGNKVTLEPYGLLYGARPYLVAKQTGKPALRHYRLQGVEKAELTGTYFDRNEDFDLREYGRVLFGVFSEPPLDVCWRFKPEAAKDALEYVFHPDQTSEQQDDGSVIVRFRAAGALEMAWHLMTWGSAVEVLQPTDFWQREGVRDAVQAVADFA